MHPGRENGCHGAAEAPLKVGSFFLASLHAGKRERLQDGLAFGQCRALRNKVQHQWVCRVSQGSTRWGGACARAAATACGVAKAEKGSLAMPKLLQEQRAATLERSKKAVSATAVFICVGVLPCWRRWV
jgi:hypothetical protein